MNIINQKYKNEKKNWFAWTITIYIWRHFLSIRLSWQRLLRTVAMVNITLSIIGLNATPALINAKRVSSKFDKPAQSYTHKFNIFVHIIMMLDPRECKSRTKAITACFAYSHERLLCPLFISICVMKSKTNNSHLLLFEYNNLLRRLSINMLCSHCTNVKKHYQKAKKKKGVCATL